MPKSTAVDIDCLKPSIHPAYGRLLCAHLNNQGVPMNDLFKGSSLKWEKLLEQSGFISYEQFLSLCRNGIRLTNCPWLGLEISTMIQVSAHGPMGYGALAAHTVGDAFGLVEKFLGTRITIYGFKLEEQNGRARFHLQEFLDPGEIREFMYVMLFGSFLDLLEKTSGSVSHDIRVCFPFPEPEWSNLYADRFPNIQICFGERPFGIDMPLELLSQRCLTGDRFAYRNAIRECEQLLAMHEVGGELSEQIKNRLFELGAPFQTQEQIAEHYHLTIRTLIRRLKAEQTSYQMLLDEVRKELACWYLQNTELNIEQIADCLGYKDTSNFSRVFRRWIGCMPSEFR